MRLNDNAGMLTPYNPITVHADRSFTPTYTTLPGLYLSSDSDGQEINREIDPDTQITAQAKAAGWELLTGYSGSSDCNGPMIPMVEDVSERLVNDVLAHPGTYVVVPVEVLSGMDDEDSDFNSGNWIAGWVVAKKTSE